MRSSVVAWGLIVGLSSPLADAQDAGQPASYQEMRKTVGELYQQKKYAEAAALLEQSLDRYPENVKANCYNLATMRVMMGDNEKAVQALEEGLRRGIFYGLWDFTFDVFQPLQKEERFQAFWKRNLARIEEAQSRATMKLHVVRPAGYDPAKSYPLFVALHGGGGNLTEFEPAWKSPRLRAEFITAYVQSSQVADMAGFHWQDEARTRRDLEVAFQEVVAKHAVDRSRVLVGGFSSGGFASLAVAFHQFLPVRGFVALCPEVPASIADGDIVAATKRSLRGTLLTTELDHRLDQQRALAARLTALGLENEIVVTPNTGHWYPKDFEEQLDRAIAWILNPTRSGRDAGR